METVFIVHKYLVQKDSYTFIYYCVITPQTETKPAANQMFNKCIK